MSKTRDKSVSIPEDLFVRLTIFVMNESYRTEERKKELERDLMAKMDRMAEHDLYTKYKTAPTEEQREQARIEYCEKRGIPTSFRW